MAGPREWQTWRSIMAQLLPTPETDLHARYPRLLVLDTADPQPWTEAELDDVMKQLGFEPCAKSS